MRKFVSDVKAPTYCDNVKKDKYTIGYQVPGVDQSQFLDSNTFCHKYRFHHHFTEGYKKNGIERRYNTHCLSGRD